MRSLDEIVAQAFSLQDEKEFEAIALELFRLQVELNPVYRRFTSLLGIEKDWVSNLTEIPFMPVEFFRDHDIITGEDREDVLSFQSSGTTGSVRSVHRVLYPPHYDESLLKGFRHFFGDPSRYHILALLPGYSGHGDSSLVYMIGKLMERSGKELNRFFNDDFEALHDTLTALNGENVILIGVTYALLDFVRRYPVRLPGLTVVETGGMKGRGPELIREDLHARLKKGFGIERVGSEYGMTELLSQAWSSDSGKFHSPPWMKVMIRDIHDPFCFLPDERTGGINIIDLANAGSCAFLATKDLGKMNRDRSFEVLGRFDHSDLRGCNLMYTG